MGMAFNFDDGPPCEEPHVDWREQEIIREIIHAIKEEGPNPEHHRAVLKRHIDEWPTLWAALLKLLKHRK